MSESEPSSVSFEGRWLLGRYVVGERLADGAMGSVYEARDEGSGAHVLVKVPHARFRLDSGFCERFRREIKDLVALEHGNLARVLARGDEEGVPFFVVERAAGGSLVDRLAAGGGKLSASEVGAWIEDVAKALDFVHLRGVIHRDVEPQNILFDEDGRVFLSDFAIANALPSTETGTGQTASSARSRAYAAPEVVTRTPLGAAYDQYSLAVVVYQALAGRLPHEGADAARILSAKATTDPTPLSELAPTVPAPAASAVMRALSRDPNKRFSTCAAFAREFLRPFGKPRTGAAPGKSAPASANAAPLPSATPAAPAVVASASPATPAASPSAALPVVKSEPKDLEFGDDDLLGPAASAARAAAGSGSGLSSAGRSASPGMASRPASRPAGASRPARRETAGMSSWPPTSSSAFGDPSPRGGTGSITIDVDADAAKGSSAKWVWITLVVVGVIGAGIAAAVLRPWEAQGPKVSSASRLRRWIDQLVESAVVEPAKREEWTAKLGRRGDPAGDERGRAEVESEARAVFAVAVAEAANALRAWDAAFEQVDDDEAFVQLRTEWEKRRASVAKATPGGADPDESVLGERLALDVRELVRTGSRPRIRLLGPNPKNPFGKGDLTLRGELVGGGVNDMLEVNGKLIACAGGRFRERIVPAPGAERVDVVIRLAGSPEGERTFHFAVDLLPPVIKIDEPPERSVSTDRPSMTVRGHVVERQLAQLVGPDGPIATDSTGGFQYSTVLATEGERVLEFNATDKAGNAAETQRVVVSYHRVTEWLQPLERAKEAHARGDVRTASTALAEAERLRVPEDQVPSALAVAVAKWRRAPTLVVTSPADGTETEALDYEVRGVLEGAREGDQVVVADRVLARDAKGAFHATLVRPGAGSATVLVEVRDGAEVRAQETRRLTFYDPSLGRLLYRVDDPFLGTAEQSRLARDFSIPLTVENPWRMEFRLLPIPPRSGRTTLSVTYLQVREMAVMDVAEVVKAPPPKFPRMPVTNVSEQEILGFIRKMSETRRGEPPSLVYRLPTSEEWEVAAGFSSAATRDLVSTGKGFNFADQAAYDHWKPEDKKRVDDKLVEMFKQPDGNFVAAEVPVSAMNPMGFFDLYGNVWEWTSSFEPNQQDILFVRGGSWKTGREVTRGPQPFFGRRRSTASDDDVGFRLAIEVDLDRLKAIASAPAPAPTKK